MDFYQVLKVLQDSGQFDKLRAEIFANPSIKTQFEVIQQRLIDELKSSPLLLDVPLKMRQARLPQIFNSFRLAVRKTSVANDIHAILWNVINEMAPEIYSALEYAIAQPESATDPKRDPERNPEQTSAKQPILEPDPSEPKTDQPATQAAALSTAQDVKQSAAVKAGKDDAPETKESGKPSKGRRRPRLVRLDSKAAGDESHSASDNEYVPAQKRSSLLGTFTSPQEPISKRVEIWWPLDKTWYKGTVTAFRARDKTHHIRYDDNEIEWLDLVKEKWRYER